ncbi:class I SAM-dependent methyltransferase [Planctomycetales bacterium ZRK34]|nr:class I SAM-dependent methyltransferase [Planctomycetales bacterium ZRK34]
MTQLQQPDIDLSRKEQFAGRLVDALNAGAMSMMLSIGHRTGLFDTMSEMDAATVEQIAEQAKLQPRYVREWLGAMVTWQVVEYDPALRTYTLPAEHAAMLTRAATPENIAGSMQWFSVLGGVEDEVVRCFRDGGGVPYERFNRFHEVMAEESLQTVVAALFDHILPLAPGIQKRLEAGIDVCDVGCGSGWALMAMAEQYPASQFTGYDFFPAAVQRARDEAQRRGLTNVRFEVRDAAKIDESESFDLITTFDAIHDQVDPAAVLRNIFSALRPGGTYLAQDIRASSHLENNLDHPVAPFLYTISTMHCMTVSLAHCGCGLGTCWGEEMALRMFREAGFSSVDVHTLEHDIMNNFYIMRKP